MNKKLKKTLFILGGIGIIGGAGLYINHATKISGSTYEHVPTDLVEMHTSDGEEVPVYEIDSKLSKRIDWSK